MIHYSCSARSTAIEKEAQVAETVGKAAEFQAVQSTEQNAPADGQASTAELKSEVKAMDGLCHQLHGIVHFKFDGEVVHELVQLDRRSHAVPSSLSLLKAELSQFAHHLAIEKSQIPHSRVK